MPSGDVPARSSDCGARAARGVERSEKNLPAKHAVIPAPFDSCGSVVGWPGMHRTASARSGWILAAATGAAAVKHHARSKGNEVDDDVT